MLIETCVHIISALFISSSVSLLCSLTPAQVLPEEFTSLCPPVSEARADCLTAGVPGPPYRSPCPDPCPLQLAVLAFCSPCCCLRTQAAGVPANLCPLPSPLFEWTHLFWCSSSLLRRLNPPSINICIYKSILSSQRSCPSISKQLPGGCGFCIRSYYNLVSIITVFQMKTKYFSVPDIYVCTFSFGPVKGQPRAQTESY